eukprot:2323997-Prorocentrum_lima.AAC.1
MTSSLVGSEMCIRDRHMCPPTRMSTPGAISHVPGRLGFSPAKGRLNNVPVSYTHLTLPTICSV